MHAAMMHRVSSRRICARRCTPHRGDSQEPRVPFERRRRLTPDRAMPAIRRSAVTRRPPRADFMLETKHAIRHCRMSAPTYDDAALPFDLTPMPTSIILPGEEIEGIEDANRSPVQPMPPPQRRRYRRCCRSRFSSPRPTPQMLITRPTARTVMISVSSQPVVFRRLSPPCRACRSDEARRTPPKHMPPLPPLPPPHRH